MTNEPRSRFQVVAQLAAGVATNVWLCRLLGVAGFEKEVAVKRLVPTRADAGHARLLLDEGSVAARLNHANIAQVFELGEEAGLPYIAMEYVRGVSLTQLCGRMAAVGRIDLGLGVQLCAGVASAVTYLHQAEGEGGQPLGLLHRNISPANVMVSLAGVAKLLDFGLATTRHPLTPSEAHEYFAGDLRYVAPEQLAGSAFTAAIDERADVFSLGVLLYELTTARNPYGPPGQAASDVFFKIVNGGYSAPSSLVPGYPPELEHVVLWAMEPDVGRRCPSARVFLDHLHTLAGGPGDVVSAPVWIAWLRELFPELANTPRPALAGTTAAASAGTLRTPGPVRTGGRPAGPPPSVAATRRAESSRSVPGTTTDALEAERPIRDHRALMLLAPIALVAAAAVAIWVWPGSSAPPATTPSGPAADRVAPAAPVPDAGVGKPDAAVAEPAKIAPSNDPPARPTRRPARLRRDQRAPIE